MNEQTPAPGEGSKLARVLATGRFAITAEVVPPASCDPQDLLSRALPLRGLADAVNVTDGAGARAHLSAVVAGGLLVQNGIEPIVQLTCRDRNRIALQMDLMGAAALGAHNLLVLRGDDPSQGDQPDAKPVFDLDSADLMATAVAMRDKNELPSGRKVGGRAPFFIGVADSPIDPPADWKPGRLKAKVDAGADFAQTQFCMDAGVVRRYAERLGEAGILPRLKMLVGVAPLRSAKQARWMCENLFGVIIAEEFITRMEGASDEIAEGKRIAGELIAQLVEIPGVAGVHIMAPQNAAAIPDVIAAADRLGRRQVQVG
jgi:methylenetetrahydrofolate reductase (NADPH)